MTTTDLKQEYAKLSPTELRQHITAAIDALMSYTPVVPTRTPDGKLVQIIDIPTLMQNGQVEMVRETLIEGEQIVKDGRHYLVVKNEKGALYRKSLEGQLRPSYGGMSPQVFAAELNLAAVKQLEETDKSIGLIGQALHGFGSPLDD